MTGEILDNNVGTVHGHKCLISNQFCVGVYIYSCKNKFQVAYCAKSQDTYFIPVQQSLCKKASNHHANLPLEMYSLTL